MKPKSIKTKNSKKKVAPKTTKIKKKREEEEIETDEEEDEAVATPTPEVEEIHKILGTPKKAPTKSKILDVDYVAELDRDFDDDAF